MIQEVFPCDNVTMYPNEPLWSSLLQGQVSLSDFKEKLADKTTL